MIETIDVTGLPPDAIRAVQTLIDLLRDQNGEPTQSRRSIFELFGKAPTLRSGEDIERQFAEEREAWGEL